jgi:hypothetical protein
MNERLSPVLAVALVVYALVESGCGGFAPTWIAPLLELGAAAFVVKSAGAPPASRWKRAVRLGAPALAIAIRHAFDIDAAGTAGLIAALSVSAEALEGRGGSPRRTAIEACVALLALRALLSTLVGYYAEEALARAASQTASLLLPGTTSLGPTFGGARAGLSAFVVGIAMVRFDLRRVALLAGVSFSAVVAATTAVEVAARALPVFGSSGQWRAGALVASQLPWLAFAIVVATSVALLRRCELRTVEAASGPAIVTVLAAAGLLLSLPGRALSEANSVYFYEPGYQNWSRPDPDFAVTGGYSAGMLGTLPDFCRATGAEAELGADLSEANLSRFDTLVLVNQRDHLPEGARGRIDRWVRRGGRLIVVGDHTFFVRNEERAAELYLNEPLEGSGIEFPNNSADYLVHGFREATVLRGLGRPTACVAGNPIGSAIGAGLALEWPARPLVVGRFGFNDLGLEETEGDRIGNLAWDRGERLGDLVLAAETRLGEGRILVVGDTTGITNIGRSFAWKAWAALLAGNFGDARWSYIAAALVLLATAAWLLRSGAARGSEIIACVSSAAFGAIAFLGAGEFEPRDALARSKVPLGVVETATRPGGRAGSWQADGRLALHVNLLRSGYLPVFADTSRERVLDAASVLIVSAPRVDPGQSWSSDVVSWVRTGGHLVIGCSYPDAKHIARLCEALGVEPTPTIVGPVRASLGEFGGRSHSIELAEPWKLRFTIDGWRALVYRGDDVLIATRGLGRGRVTFVADGTFLNNESLELEGEANLSNLRTLKLIFEGTWSDEDA